MIGQPVIMVILLTLGLEIFLRGLLPGVFGGAVKRLDIGISNAPLFGGDLPPSRTILIEGTVSLGLPNFENWPPRKGSSFRPSPIPPRQ